MIAAEALIAKFRQALEGKWGYIWGTAGEAWTEAKQKELEKTTDSGRAQGRQYGSKWIGHTVADCSGLFSWAFKQLGGYMYHGSDTMYRKYCVNKGELSKGKRTDRGTLKPGTAVFVVSAGKWTHWGELAGIDYINACNEQLTINNEQLKRLTIPKTIRKGSKGEIVKEMQRILERLGYDLGACGVDGDFGRMTEKAVKAFQKDHGLVVDGVVGLNTWKALTNQNCEL